jgi:hypothetical protein
MKNKYYANIGVERNKKPLQNIIIIVEVKPMRNDVSEETKSEYEKYKFKDLGYITWSSGREQEYNKHNFIGWHGFITPEDLKLRLGEKQWAKFCQGKRKFVIQRRIDGKNISKNKN